jgi:23S rRNA (cytidine1920-2'-O)/16S rRNA (cytidine1409-2'-O)-methyltransferase
MILEKALWDAPGRGTRSHYNARMPKKRLDLVLVERGLTDSRAQAQALIMAGAVRVGSEVALKPSTMIAPDARVEVKSGPRFVSRGGGKLEAALVAFRLDVGGRVCADVGASTGGFTDCLLQRGAAKVYAIDVGKGVLDWKLRNDPRVVVMESTNARHVAALPEPVSMVTLDASFISLRILLPVVREWLPIAPVGDAAGSTGDIVALIKPQFEAGRKDVQRGKGVIREPEVHRQVLTDVLAFAESEGLWVQGLIRSPLLGPKGNAEFLAWLRPGARQADAEGLIDRAVSTPAQSEK